MAKPLRPKRGTTAKNDAFTGLASEITIDTDKHSIRVHDGVTAGGHEILPNCLPTSGGKMTGKIETSVNESLSLSVDSGNAYAVRAERTDTGNRIYFGIGQSGQARGIYDHAVGQWLVNFDDENVLKTRGKKVITEEGGTVTGDIIFNHAWIKGGPNQTSFGIYSGEDADDGARLVMYNKNYTNQPGWFVATATHDGSSCQLIMKPDGTAEINGGKIGRIENGSFKYGTVLYHGNDDVDLNTITESGTYAVVASSSAVATQCNFPTNGGTTGILVVQCTGSGHVRQTYYRIGTVNSNDYNVFNRSLNLNNPTYGNWYQDVYLIYSWQSGANWCRKYSDGWIEQGGFVKHGAVNNYTVTFNTAFKDTNYTALVSPVIGAANGTGGDGSDLAVISGIYNGSLPYGKSKTQLRVSTYSRANDGFNWYACGF